MAIAQIRRDPFGRGGLERESVKVQRPGVGDPRTCGWCGQSPRVLYRYRWYSDGRITGGSWPHDTRQFCNVACFESYYG